MRGNPVRLVTAAALLLGEYLTMSHMVDARIVAARGGFWTAVAHLGSAGPMMVTTAAAWFMLFRLAPIPVLAPQHPLPDAPWTVRRAPWLLAHGVSFGALVSVTAQVFGSPVAPSGPAPLWVAAWCMLTILVVVSGLLGVLGGARWLRVVPQDLRVAGPVGLLAWLGGLASAAGWTECSPATLVPAAQLLAWFSVPTQVIPGTTLIRVDRFVLAVTSGCSGHEGYGIFGVLMLAFLFASRKNLRSYRTWMVLPLGLLVVWAANVLRFAVLASIGVLFQPSLAVASFHSKTSWVLFSALAVGAATVIRHRQPEYPGGGSTEDV